jgi:glycosyltransferase involved in cell wall biosynthesis
VVDALRETEVIASHFALYAVGCLDLLRKYPHVVHFHGPWATESAAEGAGRLSVAAKRFVERRIYATADRAITLSHAFATILMREYGVPEEIVRVIPGGIDLPTLPLAERSAARAQLGWPADRPIVLCVRRLARRMGIDGLIDAAAIVRKTHPEVLFHLAGKGAIREELQSRIDAASLQEHVKLLGFVPDEQLALAYAAADLSVVPSQALEGFGLITLESLVQGTPVLVTPVGGLPEVVSGLDPALVMPGGRVDEIAESVSAALSDLGRLPGRERCRAYAVDHFGWPAIAGRVMDVYREAVDTCKQRVAAPRP